MKKYPLKDPFDWDGKKVESVEIPELRGAHIKHIGDKPTLADLITVAVKATSFTPAFFDRMSARDVLGIAGLIGDFLSDGQGTGAS